jgi:signal transduction histidine kinase
MIDDKYFQRLRTLFSDLECLEANPGSGAKAMRLEIDAFRARLQELESEFSRREMDCPVQSAPAAARLESSIIYEKDKVGYAFAGDKLESIRQISLAETGPGAPVVIPLIASGQTIGAVQIQPPLERPLTSDEMNLADDVVHQVSQQIQNLRLLSATERARADAEASTRRFVHEGWASYLDAIHQNERIGYLYDQASVMPYLERLHANSGFQEPVLVTNEQIGALYLGTDPGRPLSDDDKALVSAVARQLGQQVENLRLLADASRARAEAEEVTRNLTRDSWKPYTAGEDGMAVGFVYDSNHVTPLVDSPLPEQVNFVQPLMVRGEAIGQLAVAGWKDIPADAADLASAVAAQTSIHIETLRLTEELKKRAAEMSTLNQVIGAASQTLDLNTILETVLEKILAATMFSAGLISMINPVTEVLEVGAIQNMPKPIHDRLMTKGLGGSLCAYVADSKTRMSIADLTVGAPVDVSGLINNGLRSYLGVPIIGKGRILGTVCIFNAHTFESNGTLLLMVDAIANQLGIAIENARLYTEQTDNVIKLRELDRLKTAFLANMSHELRTPLNSILGFSDVILEQIDGPLTEPMRNDLQLIQKNGQHLLHLINDVLDMAKIEAGRFSLSPEKFVVHEILDDVLSITSTLASEKNLSIFVEADSDAEVEIFADRTRLRQVMINLVNNSIKFTEKGSVSIRTARQGTDSVLISVRDTGIGIPTDKLETIFQEFAQIDTSTTRKTGGTGLGLPISRRLIALHGGRLWAESDGVGGGGSVFHVELPLEARMLEPVESMVR